MANLRGTAARNGATEYEATRFGRRRSGRSHEMSDCEILLRVTLASLASWR